MLATFRRKKKDLAQIGIYMPHQPLETIEAKLAEYDTRSTQKPTFQRWTYQEDKQLAEAVRRLGDRWAEISETYFMPPVQVQADDTGNDFNRDHSPGSSSSSESAGYRQGAWSEDEIELFRELVNPDTRPGANDWEAISQAMGTRSAIQCHSQFKTVLHSGTKGKWTLEEIGMLKEAVELYGREWQAVSKHVGTRAPGQVRQKWNQLSDKAVERLEARSKRKVK
ncbi:Myblike DNAbinding domain-containing protein [Podila horticola]|nr:Myblike DNAbinding domain-containing protein [Podila horticola]